MVHLATLDRTPVASAMLTSEVRAFDVVTIAVGGMPVMRMRTCVVVRRVFVRCAGLANEAEDGNGGDDRQPDHSMHMFHSRLWSRGRRA